MRYRSKMKLARYLKQQGLSDAEFGTRAGLHRTEVWNYRTGRRMPRADAVAAIEKATKGDVRARDFIKAA